MRQNVIVVLLSVIATLLLVIALKPSPAAVGQTAGGGTATIGGDVVGATGTLPGGAAGAAFWIYEPHAHRLAVYTVGNAGLELKAVRDVQWDLQALEFPPGKQTPAISAMKAAVQNLHKKEAAAAEKAQTKDSKKKGSKKEEEEPAEEEGEAKDGK